jgi:translation initiation factor IF-1
MPKIRGVKPDYWTDDDVVEVSIPARLLFIGMWNFACDNGHLQDKTRQLKMRILPGDDVNVAELLREIEAAELISRADGWITIPNLTKHQKPHKSWWTTCEMPGCVLPEGASHAPGNRGTTVAKPLSNRSATADVDVDCDVELKVSSTAASATPARKTKNRTPVPSAFKPTAKHREKAKTLNLDVDLEVEKFCDYHLSKGTKNASWDAAFNNWLRIADEFRSKNAPTPTISHLRPVEDIEEPPPFLSPDEYEAWRREKPGRR